MTKEAVILAAGRGMRLGGEVNGDPKCLIPMGNQTMLEHQLDALESIGVERVFLVVGHEADRVCELAGNRCICVSNPRYAETNSLYSLWVTRNYVSGSFMLLNSDVIAHPEIYRRVAATSGTMLAHDSSSGNEAEHMKVSFSDGKLRAISKTLDAGETDGENVGILQFDKDAASMLFEEADAIIESGDLKCWAPAAVDRICSRVGGSAIVRGVDVADLPWTEIDFPEDLAFARETVWPAIDRCQATGFGIGSAEPSLRRPANNQFHSIGKPARAKTA